MTNAAIARIDAAVFASLRRAGLADAATYQDELGTVPCTVVLERDIQELGDIGQVIGQRTVATFQLVEVPRPKRGATLSIGSETWALEKPVQGQCDESSEQWVLNDG
ncbi:MAG: hypothetical protein J0I77_17815 [Rudaea sp.]|uniref:head-tail joining protein n=1 Tax=unclassified Rudaea TaxID=2627037 RepID=UPI0010F43E22|nr:MULTISPECIES: hypothetical protein [unclassified Rudaea]MBN8887586.1 hypothetical protein [Rudaea sp.]MBQ3300803.1 hypothetical protein [Eggerthellaceae bacterium]